jgi:hypothetical protein
VIKRLSVVSMVASFLMLFASAGFAKDPAFDAFWLKFQTALKANDKEALASMTRLPFQGDSNALDKKAFVSYCDKLFDKKTRSCLAKQKPVQDKTTFCAFCGETIFVFEKVSGKYLFTELGVND